MIVRGTGFGFIGEILFGIAGALIANFVFPKLGIRLGTGLVAQIIQSAIGARSSGGYERASGCRSAHPQPSSGEGEMGRVSMSVVLVPFSRTGMAAG